MRWTLPTVAVDYEPLPAVGATADATRRGAPPVWDEAPHNIAFVAQAGRRAPVDRAFESAAHVTRVDFVVTRVAAAPLEPRSAVGEFDRRTGRYTLHTGIQAPHGAPWGRVWVCARAVCASDRGRGRQLRNAQRLYRDALVLGPGARPAVSGRPTGARRS